MPQILSSHLNLSVQKPTGRRLARVTVGALFGLVGWLLTDSASATDVGVSVTISQPGVYGRVDIGRFPQPEVVVSRPVVIVQPTQRVVTPPEPVYLWVPPGHRKNWRKHCARYNACGVPVYFVQDRWYDRHVRPAGPHDDDNRGHGGQGPSRGHGHRSGGSDDDRGDDRGRHGGH